MTESNVERFPTQPGLYDREYELADGKRMRFSLSVPTSPIRSVSQAPLALVLHYGGPPSGYYGRPLIEQLFQPVLAEFGTVIVAPVTLGGDWTEEVNQQAVFELLEAIQRAYSTDPHRRLIAGYSMGAAGTWHTLEKRAGYFSAAIPISGFKNPTTLSCETPMTVLHSRADSIFDVGVLEDLIAQRRAEGCDIRAEFIDGVDHFNIPAFQPLLERTVPWLRELWGRPS